MHNANCLQPLYALYTSVAAYTIRRGQHTGVSLSRYVKSACSRASQARSFTRLLVLQHCDHDCESLVTTGALEVVEPQCMLVWRGYPHLRAFVWQGATGLLLASGCWCSA